MIKGGPRMHALTCDLLRASVALQVAALEWDNTEVSEHSAIVQANKALAEGQKRIAKLVKQMEKEL